MLGSGYLIGAQFFKNWRLTWTCFVQWSWGGGWIAKSSPGNRRATGSTLVSIHQPQKPSDTRASPHSRSLCCARALDSPPLAKAELGIAAPPAGCLRFLGLLFIAALSPPACPPPPERSLLYEQRCPGASALGTPPPLHPIPPPLPFSLLSTLVFMWCPLIRPLCPLSLIWVTKRLASPPKTSLSPPATCWSPSGPPCTETTRNPDAST